MIAPRNRAVIVDEIGGGPYAELVTVGHHVMRADENEAVGGRDTGPSPYEYLMAGLGACTAMTLRMYASRHGWPLEKISVGLRHEKTAAADGGTKIDRFERIIHLQGDLSDEQRTHMLEIADRCPVSQTLQRSSVVVSLLAEGPLSADP